MDLPNLRTRKAERAPIVDLLENAEFATADDLADAVLKQAYRTLMDRDWYLTVAKLGQGMQVAYGLFATPAAAKRAEFAGGFERAVLPVRSGVGHLSDVQWYESPAATRGPHPK